MCRECYLQHPYDDYFRITMYKILDEDDVEKYHEFVEVFQKTDYPALLDSALERVSLDCVFHIIQGILHGGPPSLALDHIDNPQEPVLYQAICFMCEPRVFHLLLQNCQAAYQVNVRYRYCRSLLIDLLLVRLDGIPPLSEWVLGKPLFQVVASLFLPQLRKKLECARLLALHTYSLDKLAWRYVLDGKIIPLAALLLVAPFTEREFHTIKSNTSILASKAIHGEYVKPTFCVAAALVYIFDKDGDKLTSAFNNGQEPAAGVMAEIAVTSDIYSNSSSHPEWLEIICEGLGSIEMEDKHKSLEKRLFVHEKARI